MDDDNYTILDEPDEPSVVSDEADDSQGPSRGVRVPVTVGIAGVLAIAAAGASITWQSFEFEGEPSKFRLFVNALNLPLSIAGALLVVFAVILFVLRDRLLPEEAPPEIALPEPSEADG